MKKSELKEQIAVLRKEIEVLKNRVRWLELQHSQFTVYPSQPLPEPFVFPNKYTITFDSDGTELTKSAYTQCKCSG